MLLHVGQSLGKALVMHDLALAKEFYGIAHVGVIHKTKYIVIGGSRLLLC